MSSFGNPSTRKTWAYWTKSSRQSPGHLRDQKHNIQGEAEVSGFVQPGKDLAKWESSCCFELPNWAYRNDEARLFSELHRERTRDNSQVATKEILSGHRKNSSVRVLGDRNRLPRKGRNPSLKLLRIQLDCPLQPESWSCFEQGTGFDDLQKSFSTKF